MMIFQNSFYIKIHDSQLFITFFSHTKCCTKKTRNRIEYCNILQRIRILNTALSYHIQVLGFLEGYVADDKFAAGTDGITLGDLPLVATYATLKPTEVYQHLADFHLDIRGFII